jgi:hypothetical protein
MPLAKRSGVTTARAYRLDAASIFRWRNQQNQPR